MLIARFDGGCIKNPGGSAACACVIMDGNEELYRASKYLGSGNHMTNNVAEFEGAMMILRWIDANYDNRTITIIGDSQVVINRMKTAKRPATGLSSTIANKARREYQGQVSLGRDIRLKWQPREHNDACDGMCDVAIHSKVDQHFTNCGMLHP